MSHDFSSNLSLYFSSFYTPYFPDQPKHSLLLASSDMAATICISNCDKDTRSFPMIRRANYVNLYKWPESDAEFVKTARSKATADDGGERQYSYFLHQPRVVDSISCRQLYISSAYTFSRKESVPERTKKCLGRVKERVAIVTSTRKFQARPEGRRSRRTRFAMVKRAKEFSCVALRSIFHRLLSCTTTVDVVEHK